MDSVGSVWVRVCLRGFTYDFVGSCGFYVGLGGFGRFLR